jgi:hypothetical protein
MTTLSRRDSIRFTAWLACLALVLLACGPTLTRLLAAQRGDVLPFAVCRADTGSLGAATVASPVGQAGDEAPVASDAVECPYCALQAHSPALLPPDAFQAVVLAVSDDPPQRFLRSSRPLHAWTAAHPRGPPAIA